jgi:Ran GTPase-activating protein (RanGAP) involved in mRNA processing and transport
MSKVKVLDLSKNNICSNGIKVLADVIRHNQIIQVLDLSKNKMGVPGANMLALSLK